MFPVPDAVIVSQFYLSSLVCSGREFQKLFAAPLPPPDGLYLPFIIRVNAVDLGFNIATLTKSTLNDIIITMGVVFEKKQEEKG
jgi:hypothetical protein